MSQLGSGFAFTVLKGLGKKLGKELVEEIGERAFMRLIKIGLTMKPAESLWQIVEPKELVVVASTAAMIYTGEYSRPVTGVGQLRALAYAAESLKIAYEALDLDRVYLSEDPSFDPSGKDLLLLGSPKTNRISRKFLSEIVDDQPAIQEGSVIRWRKWDGSRWTLKGVPRLVGKAEGEEVISDYGLIVRAQNPFKKDRTAILFSGSHTYGTVAAAKYFVTEMLTDKEYIKSKREKMNNIVALVRAKVERGSLVKISRPKGRFYAW